MRTAVLEPLSKLNMRAIISTITAIVAVCWAYLMMLHPVYFPKYIEICATFSPHPRFVRPQAGKLKRPTLKAKSMLRPARVGGRL
jgi:hypothetical protein